MACPAGRGQVPRGLFLREGRLKKDYRTDAESCRGRTAQLLVLRPVFVPVVTESHKVLGRD